MPPARGSKRALSPDATSETPRRSKRVATIQLKENAAKRKTLGKAGKLVPVSGFNPLPAPGLPHFQLPFAFDVPPVDKDARLSVYYFGTGEDGQLGLGLKDENGEDIEDEFREPMKHTVLEQLAASKKMGKKGVEDIEAAFGLHSLLVDSDGKIWSFGLNDNGSLGRITDDNKETAKEKESKPNVITSLPHKTYRATRVCGADTASVSLSNTGSLRLWGSFRNNEGAIPFSGIAGSAQKQTLPILPPAFTKVHFASVAAGNNHFLAVDIDGHVWSWGAGVEHCLGRELRGRNGMAAGLEPRKIALKHIVAVGACSFTSFAVDKDGVVYAWGSNAFSQTGIEGQEVIEHPTVVESLSPSNFGGAKVVQISGGEHHTLFLLSNGHVYGCGRCDDNQIGLPNNHEAVKKAKEANEAARVELRRVNAEEIESLRQKVAKGQIQIEEQDLLLQATEAANSRVSVPPVAVTEPTKLTFPNEGEEEALIIQISVGTRHNLAVSKTGLAYSFGYGVGGQLGQGDPDKVSKPRLIKGDMEGLRVVKASAGGTHCFLLALENQKAKVEKEPSADAVLVVVPQADPAPAPDTAA